MQQLPQSRQRYICKMIQKILKTCEISLPKLIIKCFMNAAFVNVTSSLMSIQKISMHFLWLWRVNSSNYSYPYTINTFVVIYTTIATHTIDHSIIDGTEVNLIENKGTYHTNFWYLSRINRKFVWEVPLFSIRLTSNLQWYSFTMKK